MDQAAEVLDGVVLPVLVLAGALGVLGALAPLSPEVEGLAGSLEVVPLRLSVR